MRLISPFLKANSLMESACFLIKELIVWALANLFIIYVFLFTTPFIFYRKFIHHIAKYYDKDITKIITGLSAVFHRDFDCFHEKPLHTIVTCLRIKKTGEPLTLSNVQQAFLEKVIRKRNSDGKLVYPELQQHYTRFMGYSFLKWDRKFDICNHVTVYHDDNEMVVNGKVLTEIWEDLMVKPFPKEKSPWEAILLENYVEEEGAPDSIIFVRLHHGLADGFCFEHIMSSLFDSDYIPHFTSKSLQADSMKRKTLSEIQKLLVNLRCLWMGPYDLVNRGLRYAEDYHSLHFPADEKSNDYFVVESPLIPVEQVKKIKQRLGIGFTTVLVGVAAGAIRKFLVRNAMPFPERCVTTIPFPSTNSSERGEKLGNEFFLAALDLPIHLEDQQTRLRHVQQSLENLRYSSFMKMLDIFLKQLSNLPSPVLRVAIRKSCFSVSYTTVPGPNKIVKGGLGGCDVIGLNFTHGLGSDSLGLVISSITYAGKLRMTLFVERNLMGGSREKAEMFVGFLMEEYQELSKFAKR